MEQEMTDVENKNEDINNNESENTNDKENSEQKSDGSKEKTEASEEEEEVQPLDQQIDWIVPVAQLHACVESDERSFEVGPQSMHGAGFKLLVFPHGNAEPTPLTQDCPFGIFLSLSDEAVEKEARVKAVFKFYVLNENEEDNFESTEDAPQLFYDGPGGHRDWGFWDLGKNPQLLAEDGGFVRERGTDNEHIVVRTRLVRPPPRTSSLVTPRPGLNGIENQGATCYLNSLLQSLFHLPAFRRIVYAMPVSEPADGKTESIPLALQRLFYDMETGERCVRTNRLTKSFGWTSLEAFTQHDVQEMLRVLTDNLEEKLKDQGKAGLIQGLFRGESINYIECINVDCESTRPDFFYDLALNVTGCRDVYESIDKFVEEEILDGDNQYRAEGFGLQDARRGTRLRMLPRVLHIQLKRFEYDPFRDTTAKVNTRHEFPPQLDLDKYIDAAVERPNGQPFVYDLFGVLVHAGDVGGGHYYAYIRPSMAPQWYRFDDDKISLASSEEALEGNYGGPARSLFGNVLSGSLRRQSAYMLVYLLHSEAESIMRPLAPEELPVHVAELARREAEKRKQEEEEKRLEAFYMKVAVFTMNDVKNVPAGLSFIPSKPSIQLRVSKEAPLLKLHEMIADELKESRDGLRLWTLREPKHEEWRLESPLVVEDYLLTCEKAVPAVRSRKFGTYGLFVERMADTLVLPFVVAPPAVADSDEKTEEGDDETKAAGDEKKEEKQEADEKKTEGDEKDEKKGDDDAKDDAADEEHDAADDGAIGEHGPLDIPGDEQGGFVPPPGLEQRQIIQLVKSFVPSDVSTGDSTEGELAIVDGVVRAGCALSGRIIPHRLVVVDSRETINNVLPTLAQVAQLRDNDDTWLYKEADWQSSVLGIVTNVRHFGGHTFEDQRHESGDLLLLQVGAPPKEEKKKKKKSKKQQGGEASSESGDDEDDDEEEEGDLDYLELMRQCCVRNAFLFIKYRRNYTSLLLSQYTGDDEQAQGDPLPPIELEVSSSWSVAVVHALLARAYAAALPAWLRSAEAELHEAEEAAKGAAVDDATINANLRTARLRVEAAKARLLAPPLAANSIRLHERLHSGLSPIANNMLERSLGSALSYGSSSPRRLLYEVLPMSLRELDEQCDLKVAVAPLAGGAWSRPVHLFAPKTSTVGQLISLCTDDIKQHRRKEEEAKQGDEGSAAASAAIDNKAAVDDDDLVESDTWLCWKRAPGGRIQTHLRTDITLDDSTNIPLYQEKLFALLPLSKRDKATLEAKFANDPDLSAVAATPHDGVLLLHRIHVDKATVDLVSDAPLQFVVNESTTFGELRERVRNRLALPAAEFNAWRFAVVPDSPWFTPSSLTYIAAEQHKEYEERLKGKSTNNTNNNNNNNSKNDDDDDTENNDNDSNDNEKSNDDEKSSNSSMSLDTHPSSDYDDKLISELLGSSQLLSIINPKAAVSSKRRKYHAPQRGIKIYN